MYNHLKVKAEWYKTEKGLPRMRQPLFYFVFVLFLEDSESYGQTCHYNRDHGHQFDQDVQ